MEKKNARPTTNLGAVADVWKICKRKALFPKDIYKIILFDEAGIMDDKILYDILKRFDLLEKWRAKQTNFSNEYQF